MLFLLPFAAVTAYACDVVARRGLLHAQTPLYVIIVIYRGARVFAVVACQRRFLLVLIREHMRSGIVNLRVLLGVLYDGYVDVDSGHLGGRGTYEHAIFVEL